MPDRAAGLKVGGTLAGALWRLCGGDGIATPWDATVQNADR